jgi:hypothetical protein
MEYPVLYKRLRSTKRVLKHLITSIGEGRMVGLIKPTVGISHQKKISRTHPNIVTTDAVFLSTSPANLKSFLNNSMIVNYFLHL